MTSKSIALLLALVCAHASAQTFDVLAYGAKGDGHTDDSAAVRAAAAALAANGLFCSRSV